MYKFLKFVEGDYYYVFYIKGFLIEIFLIVNVFFIFNYLNIN